MGARIKQTRKRGENSGAEGLTLVVDLGVIGDRELALLLGGMAAPVLCPVRVYLYWCLFVARRKIKPLCVAECAVVKFKLK
jgi:hypothetical protein